MISHYSQRTYLNSDNLEVSEGYKLYSSENCKSVRLNKDLTLDEISLKYYSTPLYYWMIGEVNNIKNPFEKIRKGSIIKVPILWTV